MIISSNIPPDKNLYYLGGKVLEVLQSEESYQSDINEIFNKVRDSVKTNFVLYTYALDWLFLIGLIKIDKAGNIIKCF